jgi:hypothetical protein
MQWKPRFVSDGWAKVARQAEKDGIIRGNIDVTAMSWMTGERKTDVREPELSEFFSDGRAVNSGQHDFTRFSMSMANPTIPTNTSVFGTTASRGYTRWYRFPRGFRADGPPLYCANLSGHSIWGSFLQHRLRSAVLSFFMRPWSSFATSKVCFLPSFCRVLGDKE